MSEKRTADDVDLELELRDRARINPNDLEKEFVRLPADIAYQAARYASAIGDALRTKARAKRLFGLLQMQERAALEAQEKTKPVKERRRITESMVDAAALAARGWIEVEEAEIEAEVRREQEKGMLLALQAKRDCLVQLGATMRVELERDPMVRSRGRGGEDRRRDESER